MAQDPESPTGRRHAHGVAAAVAVTAVLLVVGIVALLLGLRAEPGLPPPAAGRVLAAPAPARPTPSVNPTQTTPTSGATTGSPSTVGGARRIGAFLEASQPTLLDIPSIGVRSATF